MKNAILLMLLTMSAAALAVDTTEKQNGNNNNSQNNNNNNQQSGRGNKCQDKVDESRDNFAASPVEPKPMSAASDCQKLAIIAELQGKRIGDSQTRPTADGKIVCRQTGGYTADYASCQKVSLLYDSVLIAETGMFAAQKLAVESSNSKAAAMIAQKTAEGDGQNAAIEATIDRNTMNKKLYETQAWSYSSAVTLLVSGVGAWKGKNGFVKDCNDKKVQGNAGKATDTAKSFGVTYTQADCQALFEQYKESSEVFANNGAKGQFIAAVGTFVSKAAEAKKRAGISEFVADKLKKSKVGYEGEDVVLDPCVINPGPNCANTGSQGNFSSGSFTGNTVDFGSTGSGSSFGFGEGTGISDSAAGAPDGAIESVANVISPFDDQVSKANEILNPAAAATTVAGNGNAAAGGGGGGGGGGGSASLGDDLAGATADSNAAADINTNKVTGKYKGGKGGGFQALARGGKEDANPFASLFDSKGEAGGIEEDRSIASDSGEGSGLFQKISKKYGQIQQEKRIDTQTME